jgi:hypothetical protein
MDEEKAYLDATQAIGTAALESVSSRARWSPRNDVR